MGRVDKAAWQRNMLWDVAKKLSWTVQFCEKWRKVVKIRGFRIDIDGLESLLMKNSAVKDAWYGRSGTIGFGMEVVRWIKMSKDTHLYSSIFLILSSHANDTFCFCTEPRMFAFESVVRACTLWHAPQTSTRWRPLPRTVKYCTCGGLAGLAKWLNGCAPLVIRSQDFSSGHTGKLRAFPFDRVLSMSFVKGCRSCHTSWVHIET